MLSLDKITKDYYIGKKNTSSFQVVHALKNVSINFRKCEFVSILGQSGCGKTTLLNIIGGLDHYTSGDLKINGISTKEYASRDWDNYRNHSIGFIFQSYNLIPHQNVLENVELALTLSGVGKEERKKRAIEVLTTVGLADKIYSKPNQLSGGQMQRVAIARALVNNPEIILADEPTGALDSETSVQIMELLKNISKDKLIIMVTHNPDLAKKYSTRIIELFDGEVQSDSNPFKECEQKEVEKTDNKKPHMSFFTALGLSIRNLLTKKARTSLVSFAGSIGIVGIALILSMSSGFQAYIDRVQEETLSSYPISIASQTNDMTSLMEMFMDIDEDADHEMDAVYSNNILSKMRESLLNSIRDNNLKDFKTFLTENTSVKEVIKSENIKYYYGLDLKLYNSNNHNKTLSSGMMQGFGDMGSMMSSMETWSQMIDNDDLISRQYDVVYGKMPTNYNEVVIILDSNNEIADLTLYSLGFINDEQYQELLNDSSKPSIKIPYEDILKETYVLFPNSDYYQLEKVESESSEERYRAVDMRGDTDYIEQVFADESRVINLKISGIIKPKPETVGEVLSGTVGYKSQLVTEMINRINNSDVVRYQIEHQNIDVFSGNDFAEKKYNKASVLTYLASIIDDANNKNKYAEYIYDGLGNYYYTDLFGREESEVKDTLSKLMLASGVAKDEEEANKTANMIYMVYKSSQGDPNKEAQFKEMVITTVLKTQLDEYYESTSYKSNLKRLGVCDLSTPTRIDLYAHDFANKEAIVKLIDDYNKNAKNNGKEENVINYTDYVGLMMSSVSTIIDIISIVLIVFVSISLVVSSIMIGVITYISVLERIKEIGVLRAIGASKRDIKRVFTAESISIGFLSGVIGILVTLIIILPANIILKSLTDISNLARLPILGALILIGVSVLMTFIAGLLPANLASKKDPVIALRTE